MLSSTILSIQLNQGLLHAIHVKFQIKRLIAWWETLDVYIHSQLIKNSKTKRIKALNITHHLDYIRTK
jgi:predicted transposase YbfD/YdcC